MLTRSAPAPGLPIPAPQPASQAAARLLPTHQGSPRGASLLAVSPRGATTVLLPRSAPNLSSLPLTRSAPGLPHSSYSITVSGRVGSDMVDSTSTKGTSRMAAWRGSGKGGDRHGTPGVKRECPGRAAAAPATGAKARSRGHAHQLSASKGANQQPTCNSSGRRLMVAPTVRPPAERPHSASRSALVYLLCGQRRQAAEEGRQQGEGHCC